ncbi:cell wall hydrolase [Limnochorda pilosa]|uniref:Peptidoglycan-binding protein LysM n=1 Tax=Limnochorda pilosa TaxID=1555112 RepID=A0A0K2SNG6_LIMPI|nr:cell wall hydrolase [Limnochorda pilosa]BAS28663.1 peptidoglycan-binding protein LysM [Limnochorda pilosa]
MQRSILRRVALGALLFLAAALPASAATYTVQPGDSLWLIAQRTGSSVGQLQQMNGVWSGVIYPGQRLTVPRPAGPSPADQELLARLVAAEAQGEPYAGMVGVASVVLNRVKDARFPGTIPGTIYQRGAFESVSNGLIWRRQPTTTAYKAAQDAVAGWDPTWGALFFWNPSVPVNPWMWTRPVTTQIGNHLFAR